MKNKDLKRLIEHNIQVAKNYLNATNLILKNKKKTTKEYRIYLENKGNLMGTIQAYERVLSNLE